MHSACIQMLNIGESTYIEVKETANNHTFWSLAVCPQLYLQRSQFVKFTSKKSESFRSIAWALAVKYPYRKVDLVLWYFALYPEVFDSKTSPVS